jgi:predicted transcriptional regulator
MVLRRLKQEAEIALRHLDVLEVVKENQPIGIFKLAELMNMPKHKIRYSLRVLEQSGIIEPTQYGAVLREGSRNVLENLKKEIRELNEHMNRMNKVIQKL